MSLFGELRSLLQRPPSDEVWRELLRLLDHADPFEREEQLYPYAEGALRRWPEVLRVVSPDMLATLPEDPADAPPGVRLGRAMTISTRDLRELDRLAMWPALERLSVLDVRMGYGEGTSPESLDQWCAPEAWPGLRWLKVQYHAWWQPETLLRWFSAPLLSRLHALHLDYMPLTAEHVELLCHAGRSSSLRALSLRFAHELGDASAALLASSPHLGALEYLELDDAGLSDTGLMALIGAQEQLPALTHLLVPRQARVRARGLYEVFRLEGLSRIEALDLCSLNVTNGLAKQLAAQPHLSRLRHLDLERNQIGDAGALALASSPHLSGLERLLLHGNPISGAGWTAAREAPLGARIWQQNIPLQLPPPDGMRRFLEGIADAAPDEEAQPG